MVNVYRKVKVLGSIKNIFNPLTGEIRDNSIAFLNGKFNVFFDLEYIHYLMSREILTDASDFLTLENIFEQKVDTYPVKNVLTNRIGYETT